MDDGGLVAGRGKDGGGSNQVSVCMTAGGGCMDGDGLVAGEGPVSDECKSVAAGHAGRGGGNSLKVRCVWMAMESLQGRVYEWRRDRGCVDGGPMDGGRTRLTMRSYGGAAFDTACHKLHRPVYMTQGITSIS